MGARDFESGTPNRIQTGATAYAGLGTAHTHAVLCTVESLPASYCVATGMSITPTAPTVVIVLDNATNSGSIAYAISGTGIAVPGSLIIPPLNVPLLVVVAKAAGTVAPRFLLHDYSTMTTTYDAAGGTIGNRTAGAAWGLVGDQDGGGIPWDGWIGAAGQWNRALSEGEMRALIGGRSAWRSSFGRGVLSNNAEFFIDLTQPGTIRDQLNPSIEWTGGTIPAFAPEAFRWPGW